MNENFFFQTYVTHSVGHLDQLMSCGVKTPNFKIKCPTIKTKVAIELKAFKRKFI